MPAKSRYAQNGLRLGTLGSAAHVAIAFPLVEGSADDASHSHAGRIGFYASRTTGQERLALVVLGVDRLAATADGAEINGELLVSGIAYIGGPLHVDNDIVVGTGLLAVDATSGFVHISGMDGAPIGNPTKYPGRIPLVYDRVSDTLYAHDEAWKAVGGSGAISYVNPAAVPATLGGISAGSTFPTPQSMQQMWDRLLYPYQAPGFTSFALNGHSSTVEVGYTIPTSVTFSWSTSNGGNVVANSISIADLTNPATLGTGLANDGTESFTLGAAIQKVAATSHSWRIAGLNSQSGVFTRDHTVSWRWRLYVGTNAAATLTEAQIEALAGSSLGTGYAGTYALAAGGFKYIAFAHVAGGQINSVKDQATGFNVPFATAADNAAYSNVDGGGFSYALVSVTNVHGITTQYRVYRTTNVLGGAVTLLVT